MVTRTLPPSLKAQTPAQMLAFAKTGEKMSVDFWRLVELAAIASGESKSAMSANLIRHKISS